VIAAEVGYLELAYDYFGEAALMDLHDLARNTADGLHTASLAGAWLAVVAGFGGMRDHAGALTFAPRLPSRLQRLAFGLIFRGTRLRVDVTEADATYTVLDGAPLQIGHHGKTITVSPRGPTTQPIPPLKVDRPVPTQPRGRAPQRRGVDGG
jgi:alpha,alpha-trehalose phosphorylase